MSCTRKSNFQPSAGFEPKVARFESQEPYSSVKTPPLLFKHFFFRLIKIVAILNVIVMTGNLIKSRKCAFEKKKKISPNVTKQTKPVSPHQLIDLLQIIG